MDPELRTKVRIVLGFAILIVGARTAYIVYERRQSRVEGEKPRPEVALNADVYVTPHKLHSYDLQSARDVTKQPVWVQVGYSLAYYPYDPSRRKVDFHRESGMLPPLQKLQIEDVFTSVFPQSAGAKQLMASFQLDGKAYALSIGAEKGGDYKIYSDEMFFIQDPHELYKHWPADVWKAIDHHQVLPGMNELQAGFALGLGVPEGGGDYGSRTLKYPTDGKPMVITFRGNKAVEIKPAA